MLKFVVSKKGQPKEWKCLDPKGVAVSNWQKQQSRASKRNVDAVKDRRRGGRGGRDRRYDGGDDGGEREETRGLPLLRGGKNRTRTPENRKR